MWRLGGTWLAFCIAACVGRSEPGPPRAPPPTQLDLSGPSTIAVDGCEGPYRVQTVDDVGVARAQSTAVEIAITTGIITPHADPACTTASTARTVADGDTSTTFFLQADTALTFDVSVTATGLRPAAMRVSATTPSWREMDPATVPSERWLPSAVYAPAWERTYMYGGRRKSDETIFAELWEWDGTDWALVCGPCPPGPRVGSALVFDSARERLLVVLGATAASDAAAVDSTWSWNGSSWRQLEPGPSARWYVAAAYHPGADRVLLVGGSLADGTDTREQWLLDGDAWVGPTIPVGPSRRSRAAATFDPVRGGVVIYGGSGYADDAWVWDGTGWTVVCQACTGRGRVGAGLITYVPWRELFVINGYDSSEIAGTVAIGESGSRDLSNDPTQRDNVAVAWDSLRRRIVMFGGNGGGCSGDCDQTLEFGVP